MHFLIFFLIPLIMGTFHFPLHAEIQKVSVAWNNVQCNKNCGYLLEKRFNEIKGVQEVRMNTPSGYADLIWKPTAQFEYYAVHAAMAWVGLHIENMTIALRGTISHSGKQFFITSLGDNTRFQLLGAVPFTQGQYIEVNNAQNYQFDETMINKLQTAETKKEVVLIQGTFFQPWQAVSNQRLIINSATVQKVE